MATCPAVARQFLSHAQARGFFYPQIPQIVADYGGLSCRLRGNSRRRFFADWGRFSQIGVCLTRRREFFYPQIPQIVADYFRGGCLASGNFCAGRFVCSTPLDLPDSSDPSDPSADSTDLPDLPRRAVI
ncbi:MAG: hypothetical protein GX945_01435 [Lentisphaerae bacterium]|nr:hypothetical protein [Lentisphaerota bacterium]